MTQLFVASTLFGALTLAAAVDAGCFDERADGDRLLLLCNTAPLPEVAPELDELPGFAVVRARFDRVLRWSTTIAPHDATTWRPGDAAVDVLGPLLREHWGLTDGPVELVLESLAVDPSRTLARLVPEAVLTVYADGLMSCGPTRDDLPMTTARRISRLLHLDLVPGLEPLLLREHGVPAVAVPHAAFRAVVQEVAAACGQQVRACAVGDEPHALLLGQYLAPLAILTRREEEDLHLRMLRSAVAQGLRTVVVKAHPAAPAALSERLAAEARRCGVRLLELPASLPVEVWYAERRPALVVGCFSTGLVTAAGLYDLCAARVGTDLVLQRLTPYENSNRIPLVIVDAVLPPATVTGDCRTARHPWGGPERPSALPDLVAAVGYCMQSRRLEHLRPVAERVLTERAGPGLDRWFRRRRLSALGLPGGMAPRPRPEPPASRPPRPDRTLTGQVLARCPGPVRALAPVLRRALRRSRRRGAPSAPRSSP